MDTCAPHSVNFGLLYRGAGEQKFCTVDIWHICCPSVTKFGVVRGVGAYQILRDFGELRSTFLMSTNIRQWISRTLCRLLTKFGMVMGLVNGHLFPKFRELWSGDPAIPCGDMQPAVTCVSPSHIH